MRVTRYPAKEKLKKLGWTQAAAAKFLGVHRVHLSYVLNGKRMSQRLIQNIYKLPPFA